MIHEYAAIFGHCPDTVIVVQDGVIIYANAAAEKHVGARREMAASALFPNNLLESCEEKLSCALTVNGRGYNAVAALTGDTQIITLYDMEKDDEARRLMNSIGARLKERIAEIKMATGILMPYVENCGDEKVMRYSRVVSKAGYVLWRIVGNMTYLSGGDSRIFEPENTDLAALAEDIADSVPVFVGKNAPCVRFAAETPGMIVCCDKGKIELALLQLISNSIKNTGPDGEITVTVKKIRQCAVIEVADNGKGIKESELSRVWNIAAGGDGPEHGIGTGLAIVQSIARLHGGMAMLISKPGCGTRVSIMLPVKSDMDNTLCSPGIKYDCGLENIMVQLADVIPFDHFSEKFMD